MKACVLKPLNAMNGLFVKKPTNSRHFCCCSPKNFQNWCKQTADSRL